MCETQNNKVKHKIQHNEQSLGDNLPLSTFGKRQKRVINPVS